MARNDCLLRADDWRYRLYLSGVGAVMGVFLGCLSIYITLSLFTGIWCGFLSDNYSAGLKYGFSAIGVVAVTLGLLTLGVCMITGVNPASWVM
jgi:hypothetical protein